VGIGRRTGCAPTGISSWRGGRHSARRDFCHGAVGERSLHARWVGHCQRSQATAAAFYLPSRCPGHHRRLPAQTGVSHSSFSWWWRGRAWTPGSRSRKDERNVAAWPGSWFPDRPARGVRFDGDAALSKDRSYARRPCRGSGRRPRTWHPSGRDPTPRRSFRNVECPGDGRLPSCWMLTPLSVCRPSFRAACAYAAGRYRKRGPLVALVAPIRIGKGERKMRFWRVGKRGKDTIGRALMFDLVPSPVS